MCHIAHLARGSAPSTPLLSALPIRRSRQWNGSSPTTSAAPPSSSMRSVSGRSPPATPSHQRRWESSACPTKYVAQAFISRRGGRWRLRPNDDADDDADEMVNRHVPRRRVRPHPLAGVGAFPAGIPTDGSDPTNGGWGVGHQGVHLVPHTPPSRAAPAARKGGSLPSSPSPLARFGADGL